MTRLAILFAALLALALPGKAHAYFVGLCNGQPVARADNDLVPQFRGNAFAGADPSGQFDTGVNIFNANPTNFSYLPGVDFDINHVVGLGNGHTEVWPLLDAGMFNNDSFAAVGFYTLDGCTIVEGDVIFNLAFSWVPTNAKTEYNAYGDDSGDISSIPATVHELGHTLGFGHDCSTYNVMGDAYRHYWANGADAGSYIGEGLTAGMQNVYGDAGPPTLQQREVAVTHWRYASCSNPYSVHARTVIRDTGGDVLDTVDGESEPRYVVAAGQTIEAELTFENLGSTLEEGVEVGFYYSDDDTITTMDQRLGGTSLDFVRNDPDTRFVTVELPPDLPQGDGYLGVIVDETDEMAESFEANNATYIGLRVDGVDLDGDGKPDDGTETFFQYAAKVVCGVHTLPEDGRLRPGVYASTVNVLNPGADEVRFRKRLAVSFPPDEQVQGEIFDFGFDSLSPLHALKTDCDDIARQAWGGAPPAGWFEGFIVLTSSQSLDVTAVYSSSDLASLQAVTPGGQDDFVNPGGGPVCGTWGCGGCCCCGGDGNGGDGGDGGPGAGGTLTLDVEQIRERMVKGDPGGDPGGGDGTADLIPVAPFDEVPSELGSSGFCVSPDSLSPDGHIAVRVIVRNQGDEFAPPSRTEVRFGRDTDAPPPVLSTAGANTPGLTPGEEVAHEFDIPAACYGPFGQQSRCRFEILVDAATPEDVVESNEANNLRPYACLRPHIEG